MTPLSRLIPRGGRPRAVRCLATKTSSPATVSSIICPRAQDFSAWYNDVLRVSEMVDDSPIRGCMVIRPWGMGTWELFRDKLDAEFKGKGIQNAYFPLFIPQSYLSKEAEHVDGFAKECAVVTHHRLHKDPVTGRIVPDPEAELTEPLVVRPTSETAIWSTFSNWIQSHRDLPLLINQWANVVRWEMRPRPFLRTSEFLWQEGHTAHADRTGAVATAREMLELYSSVCRSVLALPTIPGIKSPSERFAGAVETFTIEACMQNGWALQCGTSHFLGQNFAKAFDVKFATDSNDGDREHVWGTSWGVSTRLMGATVMTHADDLGLVLPPAVAPVQIVIIPILKKIKSSSGTESEDHKVVLDVAAKLEKELKKANVRAKTDVCEGSLLGSRRYEWERKGVPVRLEIGNRDIQNGEMTAALRYNLSKVKMELPSFSDDTGLEALVEKLSGMLSNIQTEMLRVAEERQNSLTYNVSSYEDMKKMIAISRTVGTVESESGIGGCTKGLGLFVAPWKDSADNELFIKEDCKATIRCFPDSLNLEPPSGGTKCFFSGDQATHMAIFARAF